MMNPQMEQKIVKLLEESPEGLTIRQVAEGAKLYRATASKYLMGLELQNIIKSKKIGPAKIYTLKDNVRQIVRRLERTEVVKKKDWIDRLVSEIKTEVKEEMAR